MFRTEDTKKLEALAKKIQAKDKRLSWETCLKKAKQAKRLFNQ